MYDFDAVIADVGGYLGLLLGHSILSMYRYSVGHAYKVTKSWLGCGGTQKKSTVISLTNCPFYIIKDCF